MRNSLSGQIDNTIDSKKVEKKVTISLFQDTDNDEKPDEFPTTSVKNVETYVVIHGNADTTLDRGKMAALAKTINDQKKQVIVLDWSEAANNLLLPARSAGWIHDVAKFAVEKLKNDWKIDSKNLNLIGHSLGSYVASEIGFILSNTEPEQESDPQYRQNPNIDQEQRVNSLIALDPAALLGGNLPQSGLYDLDADQAGSQNPIEFGSVSKFSRAFWGDVASTDGTGSSDYATSANESIYIDFKRPNGTEDFLATDSHGNIVYLYRNMLKTPGEISSLFKLGVGEHKEWKKNTYGGNEAILVATAYKNEFFKFQNFNNNDPNTEPKLLFLKDANLQNDDIAYGSTGGDNLDAGIFDRNSLLGITENATFNGFGKDKLYGDSGNDEIFSGSGNDTLYGGSGNDFINAEQDNDFIDGGDDNDTIFGATGDDTVIGGKGNDSLEGNDGKDTLIGEEGNDTLWGGGDDSADSLVGGEGDDYIRGQKGNDTIFGNQGKDFINGEQNNDFIDGGDDNDTIFGATGEDRVIGGKGNDSLEGNDGKDTLIGEEGNDTLWGGGDASADSLDGGEGDDYIRGERGNDTIFGGLGKDFINGEKDNDVIDSGDDNDTIFGARGDDTVKGGKGNDSLEGNDGKDTLIGEEGNDTLWGGGGNWTDYLDGGDGNDSLLGEGGDDILIGGKGKDIIDCGNGNDTLVFGLDDGSTSRDGADMITNFRTGKLGSISTGDVRGVTKIKLNGLTKDDLEVVKIDDNKTLLWGKKNDLDLYTLFKQDTYFAILDGSFNKDQLTFI
ncbi:MULTISPECIES: hypothetical protein [unclassified Microcoleus]|uniref:hypothetical protein n=1 Tax=unclassified Microcoleus TaxID=2642155 RepID=UPI002FD22E05